MAKPNGGNGSKSNGHHESLHSFPGISLHELRQIAVDAMCDPRVVVRYLRHGDNRYTTRLRIETALRARGLDRFIGRASAKPKAAASKPSAPPPSR